MEAPSTLSIKDVFTESIYPLDSRILLVPLNEEESESWLKLKDLASSHVYTISDSYSALYIHTFMSTCTLSCANSPVNFLLSQGALFNTSEMDDELREVSIELDHPFVPVVSDFAIAAYNELCRMVGFMCNFVFKNSMILVLCYLFINLETNILFC